MGFQLMGTICICCTRLTCPMKSLLLLGLGPTHNNVGTFRVTLNSLKIVCLVCLTFAGHKSDLPQPGHSNPTCVCSNVDIRNMLGLTAFFSAHLDLKVAAVTTSRSMPNAGVYMHILPTTYSRTCVRSRTYVRLHAAGPFQLSLTPHGVSATPTRCPVNCLTPVRVSVTHPLRVSATSMRGPVSPLFGFCHSPLEGSCDPYSGSCRPLLRTVPERP